MAWDCLNNFELQAVRRLLCLEVSEAAECIGKVSSRTWQYWEAGRSPVPEDVDMEMYGLAGMRTRLIDWLLAETEYGEIGTITWYHRFDDFINVFPDATKVDWRLHQSVCAALFTDGGDVSLNADAPLNKESVLYRWFAGCTEEQLEQTKVDAMFAKKEKDR